MCYNESFINTDYKGSVGTSLSDYCVPTFSNWFCDDRIPLIGEPFIKNHWFFSTQVEFSASQVLPVLFQFIQQLKESPRGKKCNPFRSYFFSFIERRAPNLYRHGHSLIDNSCKSARSQFYERVNFFTIEQYRVFHSFLVL